MSGRGAACAGGASRDSLRWKKGALSPCCLGAFAIAIYERGGDQEASQERTVARVENVGSGPSSSTVAHRRHGRSAAANLSSAVGN